MGRPCLERSRRAEEGFDFLYKIDPGAYGPQLAIDGKTGERYFADGNGLAVEFAEPIAIDRIVFSSAKGESTPAHTKFVFVADYRLEASDDGKTWREVAHGRDRKPVNPAHRDFRLRSAKRMKGETERLAASPTGSGNTTSAPASSTRRTISATWAVDPPIPSCATALAARLRETAGGKAGENPEEQAQTAFRLLYQRAPDADEVAKTAEAIRNIGLEAVCRALLNSSELIYLD